MAAVGALLPPLGRSCRVLTATQAAITGTGAVATGLNAIDVGGVVACAANSPASATADFATIVSVSGGSVTVVVWLITASGPAAAVSVAPINVNVLASGVVA